MKLRQIQLLPPLCSPGVPNSRWVRGQVRASLQGTERTGDGGLLNRLDLKDWLFLFLKSVVVFFFFFVFGVKRCFVS